MTKIYYTPKIKKKKVIFELERMIDDILKDNTSNPLAYTAALLLEEVVTNVVKYAYPKKKGSLYFFLELTDDNVCIIIEDKGIPYNLAEVEIPKVNGHRTGGNGVRLIRNLSDVRYKRENNTNKVLIKASRKG